MTAVILFALTRHTKGELPWLSIISLSKKKDKIATITLNVTAVKLAYHLDDEGDQRGPHRCKKGSVHPAPGF